MKINSLLLVCLIMGTSFLSCCVSKRATEIVQSENTYKVVGYYPAFKYGTIDNRWKNVTHINLSFVTMDDKGNIFSDNILKFRSFIPIAQKSGVKVLASVGGGGGPELQKSFASSISVPEYRTKMVEALVSLADEISLDGLDIDYEAWGLGDAQYEQNLETSLLLFYKELREKLGNRLLTAAVCSYGRYNKEMVKYLDFITLMAYDATGPWSKEGGPHSPFSFVVSMTEQFKEIGFPASKLIPGVPFYGRGFPDGDTKKAYEMTYNEIVSKYPGAENMNSVGNELFYDGLPAIKEKCKYVVDNKLGGVMFWELSGDAVYGGKSLLKCINESLGR